MAAGDIWALQYTDGFPFYVDKWNTLGELVQRYEINGYPPTYHQNFGSYYVPILTYNGIVVVFAMDYIWYKGPNDAEFSHVYTLGSWSYLGTICQVSSANVHNGIFRIVVTRRFSYETTYEYYWNFVLKSEDGANWDIEIAWDANSDGSYIYFVHSDIETSGNYFIGSYHLAPSLIPGYVSDDNYELLYTTDFVNYTLVDIGESVPWANWLYDKETNCIYSLGYNFTVLEVPVDNPTNTRILPITGVDIDLDSDTVYWQSVSIKKDPVSGGLWVVYNYYEDTDGSTRSYSAIANTENTALIYDASKTMIFMDYTNAFRTPYIAVDGNLYYFGDKAYSVSAGTMYYYFEEGNEYCPQSVMDSDGNRFPITYYRDVEYKELWDIYSYVTMEGGEYIPIENEFWTEERLAIEQSYDY